MSISIYGAIAFYNDPRWCNRKGHTNLIVAIDDFDKRHNALQLNLDAYTLVTV